MATDIADAKAPRILSVNPLQWGIITDPHRFKVVVCGRRFGKTWTGRTWIAARMDRRCRLWYIAPTYRIAHDIIWREMLETVPPDWYAKKPNQTRLELELKTGALIQLKGADDPDSLRGRGVTRMVIDEYADMPDIWDEILRPALSDTMGEAMFLGTPKGYNHFHGLYKRGGDVAFPDWHSWHYPTASAPHFQTDTGLLELAAIKASTPSHIWRQEYEAQFEARAGMIVGPLWEPTHTVLPTELALQAVHDYRPGQRVPWHVLDDPRWTPPPSAFVYGSVDYGYGAPWAFYLTAVMTDGHLRTFHERYDVRVQDTDQARLIADDILRLERDRGVQRPQYIVGEPIMFASRKESAQKAIAAVYDDVLAPLRVRMRQGAGGRAARVSRPQRWLDALSVADDGLPNWSCTTACPNLIRTVPEVPWDEDDPNVQDDKSEDHSFEAMSRLFEERANIPVLPKADPFPHLDPVSRAHAIRRQHEEVEAHTTRVHFGSAFKGM